MSNSDEKREWVKRHKNEIIDHFCKDVKKVEEHPFAIFMCGSSGAGKTEEARRLRESLNKEKGYPCIVHIDQDAIKEMIPGYTGKNAEEFHSAASLGVEKVLDYCYSKKLPFILDSTFSKYEKAKQNIERAERKGRIIWIIYIYQEPLRTWGFVQSRERVDGRVVPLEAFVDSYFGAFETLRRIKDEYGPKVHLTIVNRENKKLHENVDRVDSYVKMGYSDSVELMDAIHQLYN